MSEPTISDLKTLLEAMAASNDRRETASVERHAKVSARLDSVVEEQLRMRQDVATLQGEFPAVQNTARQAMASHHELEGSNQSRWRSVMERLDKQDFDTANREREKQEAREKAEQARKDAEAAKADERQRESIAAKRVSDRREYWLKAAAIGAPIIMAMIGGYVAISTARAHEDTAAKLDLLSRQVSAPRPAPTWGEAYTPGAPAMSLPPAASPAHH